MATRRIYRGDDRSLEVTVKYPNGSVKDITGWTIFYMVKKQKTDSDADAVIDKTITTHTDPSNGVTVVELTDNDTDIDIGIYHEEVQTKDTSGKIQTVYQGLLEINQDLIQKNE